MDVLCALAEGVMLHKWYFWVGHASNEHQYALGTSGGCRCSTQARPSLRVGSDVRSTTQKVCNVAAAEDVGKEVVPPRS